MGASLGMSIGSNANECTTDMVPACPANIYIYIYILLRGILGNMARYCTSV